MNKTAIEWADYTWNPVTGCLHGCEYCYARSYAHRFAGYTLPRGEAMCTPLEGETGVLDSPLKIVRKNGKLQTAPFPYDFLPTFHRYRLDEPAKMKKPQNIFVCSMADLFGEWVPDEWIEEVFKTCEAAPQHRYLFLTKNPGRYVDLAFINKLPHNENFWYGSTATGEGHKVYCTKENNSFLSAEPLISDINADFTGFKWVIIGAETGNRKDKVIPKREWIENIVNQCHAANVPVFMKNSLKDIWCEQLIQEFPWG